MSHNYGLTHKKLDKNKINLAVIFLFVMLAIFSIFTLIPFYFLLVSSFKTGTDMFRNGINFTLNPKLMTVKNYLLLFIERGGIYLYWYKNSLLITLFQTIISLFLSAMVGYGLAIYKFKGRNVIFVTVLALMMLPIEILLLPLYKLTVSLRLINTYAGVILPFAVSPFAVFFFRQYALGLPTELIESGRIDGCSEFGIYFRLMLPLMKPAFAAMAILQALASWNSLVWPMIVLRTNENLTLPIGLSSLMTPYGNNYDMLMPGAVLSVVPIIIVFLFNQRAFIGGLTAGAIKK